MLKVSNVGRGRTNSFSLLDPATPTPTPSSSYIPDTLLENRMVGLNLGSEELLRAAEQFLLEPTRTEAKDAKEATRLRLVQEMCSEFLLTDEQLQHIEERMVMEVNWGLGADTNPSSNIKSYITYVSQLPTGREHGAYLALDLGGTNFRVILVELDSKSTSVRMKAAKHPVSEELMVGPGVDLFNFMADRLRDFMLEHNLLGDDEKEHHLGFTFSFPTVQHSLASADLASWTKGFICSGVEGEDVGALLEKAIARYPEMKIRVSAILNDTTGCLIACAYKRPDCAIGVIIGTGTNASYVEEIRNVEMYEGNPGLASQVVINTEWGALGNTGSLDFVRTRWDHAVDAGSKNFGKQVYEKLISGMYLGELFRQVILEAVEKRLLFPGVDVTTVLGQRDCLQTRHISAIESDEAGEYAATWVVLEELGLEELATATDCRVVRYIAECIGIRAATLAAAGVASLLNKMNRRRVTVGMDGSLYKFHPHFQGRMAAKIRHLVDPAVSFQLVLSEDGSGRGAGLAAATVARQNL